MAFLVGTPPAPESKITILGSGTYTTTGNGTYEDAGNFTTPGDLGYSTLVVEFALDRGDANTLQSGLHTAAGNAATIADTADTSRRLVTYKLRRLTGLVAGDNTVHSIQDENTVAVGTNSAFDFSAAETVYLKLKKNVALTAAVRWIAYIIKQ